MEHLSMASLHEKVEAELEQMDRALRLLPSARGISQLSGLELAGTASLLSALYHGVENIMKQALLAVGVTLPSGAAWHRDLLQSACAHGIITAALQDRLTPYMGFRHFFVHAYGLDLDPHQLRPLVEDIRPICTRFKLEVTRFVHARAKRQTTPDGSPSGSLGGN
jgi:uncharacterized protein YutE (UPF0331/DUF86 family)